MAQSAKIDHDELKDVTVLSDKQDTEVIAAQATETPQTALKSEKYTRLKLRFEALKKVGLPQPKTRQPDAPTSCPSRTEKLGRLRLSPIPAIG